MTCRKYPYKDNTTWINRCSQQETPQAACSPGLDRGITRGNCLLHGRSGLKTTQNATCYENTAVNNMFVCQKTSQPATWWCLCRVGETAASGSVQTPQTRLAESWCSQRRIWSLQQQSMKTNTARILYPLNPDTTPHCRGSGWLFLRSEHGRNRAEGPGLCFLGVRWRRPHRDGGWNWNENKNATYFHVTQ